MPIPGSATEDQHPTQQPNDRSGAGPSLDIVGEVQRLVVFEHDPVLVVDSGTEVVAPEPDLPQVVDGGLGAAAVGEHRCNVVMLIVSGCLFVRDQHPVEMTEDLRLTSTGVRTVGSGDGSDWFAVAGGDGQHDRFIARIGLTLETRDVRHHQPSRVKRLTRRGTTKPTTISHQLSNEPSPFESLLSLYDRLHRHPFTLAQHAISGQGPRSPDGVGTTGGTRIGDLGPHVVDFTTSPRVARPPGITTPESQTATRTNRRTVVLRALGARAPSFRAALGAGGREFNAVSC